MVPHGVPKFLSAQKVEVDIHGMTEERARVHLERLLDRLDGSVREVTVIHGFTSGTALRDMVRARLRHPRVRAAISGVNPGVTILALQPARFKGR